MNRGLDLIGRQIGVYRIEELIGAGGYSRVYRGLDKTVGRMAAIKMLLPSAENESYADPVIERFEREARIVANLRDPHSVLLYEYGQTDDGLLYMIFEYIEGHTLEEIRRQQFALPALRVVKILEQILLSLEEAHALGLIHRDIKPANIMLFEHIGRTDQVKVLDFGVGKATDGHAESRDLTKTGMLIGTPRYMAPEQWSSDGEISPQTDIYSLGLVIYELLTGARAITATDPVHIMRAHLDRHPIRLPEELDIPSGLRQVVNTMLHKDRARRYQSVRDVLSDLLRLKPMGAESDTMVLAEARLHAPADEPKLRACASEEDAPETSIMPELVAPPDTSATPDEGEPQNDPAAPTRPRSIAKAGLVAGLVVLGILLGGYALMRALTTPNSAETSAPSQPVVPPEATPKLTQPAPSAPQEKAPKPAPGWDAPTSPADMDSTTLASSIASGADPASAAAPSSRPATESAPTPPPAKTDARAVSQSSSSEKPSPPPKDTTKTTTRAKNTKGTKSTKSAKKTVKTPKLKIWAIE